MFVFSSPTWGDEMIQNSQPFKHGCKALVSNLEYAGECLRLLGPFSPAKDGEENQMQN